MKRVEWDTLMFFTDMLCAAGLARGVCSHNSDCFYKDLEPRLRDTRRASFGGDSTTPVMFACGA